MDVLAVAFLLEIGDGNETQRCRVDAIAQATLVTGAVREDVAQVAVTVRRTHFGADHAVGDIAPLFDIVRLERARETGPAAAAIELVERREQGLSRDDI